MKKAKKKYPQVVFLVGPSGSGKTTLMKQLDAVIFDLDHFYKPDSPEHPKLIGNVTDWDMADTWDAVSAIEKLEELIYTGSTTIKTFDMTTNNYSSTKTISLNDKKYILCEGIFAYLVIPAIQKLGYCEDIVWLESNKIVNAKRRLQRDIKEARKTSTTFILYRTTVLTFREKQLKNEYMKLSARCMTFDNAVRYLKQYFS